MKKAFSRALAALLIIALLAGGGLVQSLAVTDAQWDAIWEEIDAKQSVVALTPGSDETQRNFAWQGGRNIPAPGGQFFGPMVHLSKNADMSGAVTFHGDIELNQGTGLVTNYVTVKSLEPGASYYYQCEDFSSGKSAVYSFKTAPANSPVKVVMFSDIHVKSDEEAGVDEKSSGRIWNDALEQALAREPDADLVLSAGDNANTGAPREYLGLYAPPALKSIPFAACMGNHDKKQFNLKYYMNNPNAHNALLGSLQGGDYWFRYNDVLFLVFDSTNGSAFDHYRFAREACKANGDAKWRVAMYHHDLHATLSPIKDPEGWAMQQIFDPILADFDMDAVFVGHNHRYIRTHVLSRGWVTRNVGDARQVVDPPGMVYFGNTSVVHVSGSDFPSLNPENAFCFTEPNVVTYNVISFEGGQLNVKACRVDDGRVIDEFTIIKSEGNMPKSAFLPRPSYVGIMFLSGIYALIAKTNDQKIMQENGMLPW